MKTVLFFLLFTCNIFAQNTQFATMRTGETYSNKETFWTKNDSIKNSIVGIEKDVTINIEKYEARSGWSNEIYKENIITRDYSIFAYSFGVGPSLIIGFDDDYYGNEKKTEFGYNIFINAGKRFSENFMLKAELNYSHNSYNEYNTYFNYTHSNSNWRLNLLINGTLGFLDLDKFLIYTFGGVGLGVMEREDWCWLTNFGIGGGIKMSKNFSLTCDLMFELNNQNKYKFFTPRIGLSFIPY